MAFVRLINETEPLQGISWLSGAARRVICLFAARVDLAIALHSAENQWYNQFCQMHNVLDPNGTSRNRGRKAWLKDVAGRRG